MAHVLPTLITITSICSYWRTTAIQYSPFWAYISVKLHETPAWQWDHPQRPTRLLASDMDRVRCFLERSKQSPIYLFIPRSWRGLNLMPADEQSVLEKEWGLMKNLLAPHMGRCHSIYVRFQGTGASYELFDLLGGVKFPLLQDLVLSFSALQQEQPLPWDATWNISPLYTPLRTLRFSDANSYIPEAIDAPWPLLSLIELNVAGRLWPRVRETLAKLPTLKELRIDLGGGSAPNPPCQTRISLPLVERVVTNHPAIWGDISTPSVRYVSFTAMPLHNRLSAILAEQLGEMSVCDVTFSGFVIDSNIIFSIIQAFKRLENIHFYRSYDHGQLLSRVARALEKEVSERPLGAQMNTGFRDNSFLPFLSGVFIEDWQTRYWMFWEFPNRLLEAPLWSVRQDSLSAVEGFSKSLKACDQCLVYGIPCDILFRKGSSCTHCTDEGSECRIEANAAVVEAREIQKAVDRLQGLGIEVTWVLI